MIAVIINCILTSLSSLTSQFAKQNFIDSLNLAPTFLDVAPDVLAYIINIIKEVAEGIQEEVWLTGVLDGLRIGQDTDTVEIGRAHV